MGELCAEELVVQVGLAIWGGMVVGRGAAPSPRLDSGTSGRSAVYNGSVGYAVSVDGRHRGPHPIDGRAARQRRALQWVVGNIRQKNQLSVDREYLYCHRALFFCDASRPRMLRFAGRVRVQHPVETPADQPPRPRSSAAEETRSTSTRPVSSPTPIPPEDSRTCSPICVDGLSLAARLRSRARNHSARNLAHAKVRLTSSGAWPIADDESARSVRRDASGGGQRQGRRYSTITSSARYL